MSSQQDEKTLAALRRRHAEDSDLSGGSLECIRSTLASIHKHASATDRRDDRAWRAEQIDHAMADLRTMALEARELARSLNPEVHDPRNAIGDVLELCGSLIEATVPYGRPISADEARELYERTDSTMRGMEGVRTTVTADLLARANVDTSALPADPNSACAAQSKPRRRPTRTEADKARDEGNIAAHLADHPDATRDDVATNTGIARAHVSGSKAWKAHKAQRTEARHANRARGVGGTDSRPSQRRQ